MLGALFATAVTGWGQERLNAEMPFAAPPALVSTGKSALTEAAAHFARDFGLSSIAVDRYRELLGLPGADRPRLTLELASTLLEAGRPDEAEKALLDVGEPRSAAWHLRAGLAALQLRKYEAMRTELAAIKEAELPVLDHPWYWFLQGGFVDIFTPQEEKRANDFYVRAENAAPNELARARMQLAGEEVRLRRGMAATREQLAAARANADNLRGTEVGYRQAQSYVLMLVTANQAGDATTFLQMWVPAIPRQETKWWDDFRLMLGLIGERGRSFAGRRALVELLESGNDARRQRQALQLLWEASLGEPGRAQLRELLDRLLVAATKHRIRESLLFYRAQLALSEGNHEQVAANAQALLTEFPGSPLRSSAYALLTQLAWEQRRYRQAADNARKARIEMAAATRPEEIAARTELGVVEAEAWFRAGEAAGDRNDFRNAADAYAAALRDLPAKVKAGDLMLQRVLAEIRAGAIDAAKTFLDEQAGNPAFDPENRWQSEWSLSRALRVQDRVPEAYGRVNALLEQRRNEAGAVPPDLRAKLAWLRVALSLDAGELDRTVALAEELVGSIGDLEPSLRIGIASTALLNKAQAEFELKKERDALATLTKVRADFPKTDAAIQSYITEATYYEVQGKIVEAQKLLTPLTENPDYKNHALIPWSYLLLAKWSAQLGQTNHLEAANAYIEKLVEVAKQSRQTDLVFQARIQQGEILARLNDFPRAQRIYESLANEPASAENLILARFALARTHYAQATTDPLHAERAERLFEEVRDNVGAPPDVRVEAGYQLGSLLKSRGREDRAAKAWWEEVIVRFLQQEKKPIEAGAKRAYWFGRTLIELAAMLEQQGRLEEARNALLLVERYNLAEAAEAAKKALERLALKRPQG